MTQADVPNARRVTGASFPSPIATRQAYQAYVILHIGFVILPIVMGADKFFNYLGNWEKYLTPLVPRVTHLSPHTFMMVVGVIEIIAGLLVAFKPRIGAYILVIWLCGIIVNLLLIPGFYDVAMRDFGLLVGALALVRLSQAFARCPVI